MFEAHDSPSVSHDLVVESKEGDRRIDGFSRLGTESDDLESSSVDLLCQLVHSYVARSTDEDLTTSTEQENETRPYTYGISREYNVDQ